MGKYHSECSVVGCKSRGWKYTPEDGRALSFHRFPFDEARSRVWIELVDPSLSSKSKEQLRRLRVCGLHFTEDQFLNRLKRTLVHNAVPNISSLSGLTEEGRQPQGVTPRPSNDFVESSAFLSISGSTEEETGVAECSQELPLPAGTHGPSLVHSRPIRSEPLFQATPVLDAKERRAKRRRCLLQEMELAQKDITPKKKKILNLTRQTLRNYTRLRKRIQDSRGKMKSLMKVASCRNMNFFLQQDISPAAAALACGDARNKLVRPKHRRWTKKEKLLALALYKRSPKAYRFLGSLIVLPSRSTLQNILSSIKFDVGINEPIVKHLGEQVRKMNERQKGGGNEFCALYFDEVSLKSGLYYRQNGDIVEGFEDYGEFGRTRRQADHALVFMARGLRKQWKQPVAYYLCRSTTPTDILEELIIKVITSLSSAGIIVKAIVCDQGSTNRSAVKNLVERFPANDKQDFIFQLHGEEIVTIFDVPHLLKSMRNNFLKYDIVTEHGSAKWEHVKLLLKANDGCLYRLVNKITSAHVDPKGKDKMRVFLAAQIFSLTCSSAINVLVDGFPQHMPIEARVTALFLSFMNNLFDSLNGSSKIPQPHSPYRCRLSAESDHLKFWEDALLKIEDLKFIKSPSGEVVRPPCQKGWLTSIRAIRHLWLQLKSKGFTYFNLRSVNQDGLENFFSGIRQFGGDSNNPTCGMFGAAFKACILNGLCSSHSRAKNCEDDGELLSRLGNFLQESKESLVTMSSDVSGVLDETITTSISCDLSFAEAESVAYVSGYIAKRLLSAINEPCNDCRTTMTSEPDLELHPTNRNVPKFCSFISERDAGGRLIYPSEELAHTVGVGVKISESFLQKFLHTDAVGSKLSEEVKRHADFSWMGCVNHRTRLISNFLHLFNRITIHQFCRILNRKAGK